MKTILEWYQELPEPYRTQAMNNCSSLDDMSDSMSSAIMDGFIWTDTVEDFYYWNQIHNEYYDNEQISY